MSISQGIIKCLRKLTDKKRSIKAKIFLVTLETIAKYQLNSDF